VQEIKQLAQDHWVGKWSSQGWNLSYLAPSVNRTISSWYEFLIKNFFVFCFFFAHAAWHAGSKLPDQGLNLWLPEVESRGLTTRLPRNSLC